MALIVEDGTGVANANSFVTLDEIKAAAAARGVTLPATDADIEKLSFNAIDFIVSKEGQMNGVRTFAEQDLPYPRTGVVIYSRALLPNGIPKTLKQAQIQLVFDGANGVPLFTNDTPQEAAVKRDKVGPIETEFFEPGGTGAGMAPALDAAMSYLSPLLRGLFVRTVRV